MRALSGAYRALQISQAQRKRRIGQATRTNGMFAPPCQPCGRRHTVAISNLADLAGSETITAPHVAQYRARGEVG